MAKKKLSKSAKIRQDQKINVQLRKKFEEKLLEKDRLKEDLKDGMLSDGKITTDEIKEFNSKSLNSALESLKESGIDASSNPFADMERMLNNNEAIIQLVDVKNIRMKTNVSDEQHKIIVILYGVYKTLLTRYGIDFKGLRTLLDEFIEIAPSISGQRSEQFVTAHQAMAQAIANAKGQNTNAIRDTSDMKGG